MHPLVFQVDKHQQPIEHVYRVKHYTKNHSYSTGWDGATVDFRETCPNARPSDLPKPKYLEFHAAIAGVLHMSGTGPKVDKWLQHQRATQCLANDGSDEPMHLFIAQNSFAKVCAESRIVRCLPH